MIVTFITAVVVGVLSPQILSAESMAYPCFQYGYSEKIDLDPKTLPKGVKVLQRVGSYDGYFLSNDAQESLIIKLDNSRYVKLVDGKHFEGSGRALPVREWKLEESDVRIQSSTRINDFVKGRKIQDIQLYGSNKALPPKPENVKISIPASFDGKDLLIEGVMSYEPRNHACDR